MGRIPRRLRGISERLAGIRRRLRGIRRRLAGIRRRLAGIRRRLRGIRGRPGGIRGRPGGSCPRQPGGIGRFWRAGILRGCLCVTWPNRHVAVIAIAPLTFTTVRSITGHMALGGVAELSRDDLPPAGLASAGGRHRRRCHALTFHRRNVLLKNPAGPPAGLPEVFGISWDVSGGRVHQLESPGRRSLSGSSGGYMAHEFRDLRRHADHVADHDDRGRPHPLLCYTAFYLFQR
jgi:hypothetical protein